MEKRERKKKGARQKETNYKEKRSVTRKRMKIIGNDKEDKEYKKRG